MVFSSLTFLCLFLPLLLLLYFIVRDSRWRNGVLLIASLLFYGWGEPVWILAMIFSTLVNWLCAWAIVRAERPGVKKLCLVLGVTVSLAFLVYFKYWAFFTRELAALLGLPWSDPGIRMPIGISFYTFQVLTYTVDVYRGKVPVQRSFARLLLYVSCFPQLIAGPIVQYSDVADALEERSVSPEDFSEGMRRFVLGLAKKVLLANISGAALNELNLAGSGTPLSVLGAWMMPCLYHLQIYFDFSAYSDMAIGLGRILGFHYLENFDHPYASKSVAEYWRRWHISLGSFFRDYVYIPLGGSRRGTAVTVRNTLIVWALTGLWHGASWNFILWGLYFGFIIVLEKYVLKGFHQKAPGWLRFLLTQFLVIVSWVIFYYTELPLVGQHFLAMLGFASENGAAVKAVLIDEAALRVLRKYTVYPLIAYAFTMPVGPALKKVLSKTEKGTKLCGVLTDGFTLCAAALSVVFLVGQSYNPFIYFRF